MKQFMNIVLPMAGRGSRFKDNGYTDSKPFIDVKGIPMVKRVVDNLQIEFNKEFIFIVICLSEDNIKYNIEDFFIKNYPESNLKVIIIDELTNGAASTVLLASQYINNESPLLTLNSDQLVLYNPEKCYNELQKYDAGMLCFLGEGNKWSYADVDDQGYVTQVKEKIQISKFATAGYYFWKQGKDFVKYAEQMIENNDRTNNEFYIAPVYNQAINDGKKIGISMVDHIYQLGTPEDLQYNLSKI